VRVLVTGGRGLVGDAVLRRCLDEPRIGAVVSLGRRPTGIHDPKLTEIEVADFGDLSSLAGQFGGIGAVFHCLATYRARVGGAAYERITVGFTRELARAVKAVSPAATFCFFGAEGTSREGRSWVPALNVKGRAEVAVLEAGFPCAQFYRPAYICPSRPRRHPVFYDLVATPLFRTFGWKGIESADLAKVMVETAITDRRPELVLENRIMRDMAKGIAD